MILLIGIVKKNAILMIDFALEAERHGHMDTLEAITQACLLRFRPIIMTTTAALLGAVPLALSFGDGGEIRRPLRHFHRRWADPKPDADALHHAYGLPVSRPFPPLGGRRAQRLFPTAPKPAE